MTSLLPTPPHSRFAEWTQDDLQQAAAVVKDETQDANVRLYAVECLLDYTKELSEHLQSTWPAK